MKYATHTAVRNLNEVGPTSYKYPAYDLVIRYDDGTFGYSDEIFDSVKSVEEFQSSLNHEEVKPYEWWNLTASVIGNSHLHFVPIRSNA